MKPSLVRAQLRYRFRSKPQNLLCRSIKAWTDLPDVFSQREIVIMAERMHALMTGWQVANGFLEGKR